MKGPRPHHWALLIAAPAALSGCTASDLPIERPEAGVGAARVMRIVDGDTIVVRTHDGQRRKVRLLAIDAPESYPTRHGFRECGGGEAKAALQRLARRSPKVILETDPNQDETDRYGRLLAYITPSARRVSFQATLVRSGWAEVYRYNEDRPPSRAEDLDRLADAARREGTGVWRTCGGFHRKATR